MNQFLKQKYPNENINANDGFYGKGLYFAEIDCHSVHAGSHHITSTKRTRKGKR